MMTSLFRFLILVLAGISCFLPVFSQTAVKCDDVPGSSNDLHVFKNPKNEKDGFYMVTNANVGNKYYIVQVDNDGKIYDKERVQVELKTSNGVGLEYNHVNYYGNNFTLFGTYYDKKRKGLYLSAQMLNNDGTHKGNLIDLDSMSGSKLDVEYDYSFTRERFFSHFVSPKLSKLVCCKYLRAVSKTNPLPQNVGMVIKLFDQELNLQWERKIDLPKGGTVDDMIVSDDGIVTLCYTDYSDKKKMASMVIAIKDKTSQLQQTEITTDQVVLSSLQLREDDKTGALWITGCYYGKTTSYPEGIYYCKLSTSGEIETNEKISFNSTLKTRFNEIYNSYTPTNKNPDKPNLSFMIKDFYIQGNGELLLTGQLYYKYSFSSDRYRVFRINFIDIYLIGIEQDGKTPKWMKIINSSGTTSARKNGLIYEDHSCDFYTMVDDKNGIQVVYNTYSDPKTGKELKGYAMVRGSYGSAIAYQQFSPDGKESQATVLLPDEKQKTYQIINNKCISINANHFLRVYLDKNVSGGNISNGYYVKFTPKK